MPEEFCVGDIVLLRETAPYPTDETNPTWGVDYKYILGKITSIDHDATDFDLGIHVKWFNWKSNSYRANDLGLVMSVKDKSTVSTSYQFTLDDCNIPITF